LPLPRTDGTWRNRSARDSTLGLGAKKAAAISRRLSRFQQNGDIGAQDRILDLWGRALEGYLVDAEMLSPARDMAAGSHLRTARVGVSIGETTAEA
jgi:hypothetical protein